MSAKIAPGYAAPPFHLVPEFRSHLEETGSPHTWARLSPLKPDHELVALAFFTIPKRFIGDVRKKEGFGKCAVCCPDSPKYTSGYLIFCPSSQTLHVVGHECGAALVGVERFRLEVKSLEERDKSRRIDETLERDWDLPAMVSAYGNALLLPARKADKVLNVFRSVIGKGRCKTIIRMVSDTGGYLMKTIADDKKGDVRTGQITGEERFSNTPFEGSEYLRVKRSSSIEGRVRGVLLPLEGFCFSDQDQMIEFLLTATSSDARKLRQFLDDSVSGLLEIHKELAGMCSFLGPANISLLNRWLDEEGGLPKVEFEFTEDGGINVFRGGKRERKIPNPSDIWQDLPERGL